MTRPGLLSTVLASLLALSSCGSNDDAANNSGAISDADSAPTSAVRDPMSQSPNDDDSAAEKQGREEAGSGRDRSDGGGATTGGGSQAPTTDAKAAGPPDPPTGIVSSIEPPCPARLTTVTVVVETTPFSDISYATSFADGQNYNLYGLATSGPDGTWTFTFAVPPSASLGDGQVIVAAVHPEAGGGSGLAPFRVTQKGTC